MLKTKLLTCDILGYGTKSILEVTQEDESTNTLAKIENKNSGKGKPKSAQTWQRQLLSLLPS